MAHKPWLRCMFCTEVIVRLKWVGIGCAPHHAPEQLWRDETEMCASSRKLVTLSSTLQKTIISFMFSTFKNESHFSHSDRQTLHSLLQVFFFLWIWSDLCDPFGRAILLKRYLGRHAVIKRYVRWSLKRAKCTVCLSSNLLRGKSYIHTTHSMVGKDIKKGQ